MRQKRQEMFTVFIAVGRYKTWSVCLLLGCCWLFGACSAPLPGPEKVAEATLDAAGSERSLNHEGKSGEKSEESSDETNAPKERTLEVSVDADAGVAPELQVDASPKEARQEEPSDHGTKEPIDAIKSVTFAQLHNFNTTPATKCPTFSLVNSHPSKDRQVAFSPGGSTLLSTNYQMAVGKKLLIVALVTNENELFLYNTSRRLLYLPREEAKAKKVVFAPDEKSLAVIDVTSPKIHIRELPSGKITKTLTTTTTDPNTKIIDLAFRPDGLELAAEFPDKIVIWSLPSGQERTSFKADLRNFHIPSFYQNTLTYAPDGKSIAVGQRKNVLLFDTATGNKLWELSNARSTFTTTSLTFSPNGAWLVQLTGFKPQTGNGAHQVWDTKQGKLLTFKNNMDGYGVAYHPTKQLFATTTGLAIKLWACAP